MTRAEANSGQSGRNRKRSRHDEHHPAPGGTASLYQHFAATVVILILVSLPPPNRADNRLCLKRE